MSKKQVFLIFVTFFFTILVIITIPFWIDRVLPYIGEYGQSALDYVNRLEELFTQAKDGLLKLIR